MIREATKEDADRVMLPYNKNYRFYVCDHGDKQVYFSGVRRGDALECHVASANGKGMIRKSVNEFCDTMFEFYPWCQKITALIEKPNVLAMVKDCGFKEKWSVNGITYAERLKNG